MPSRWLTPGRKLSTTTSERRANFRALSRPSGDFRSKTTLFLPRSHWTAPGESLNFSPPGGSTLMTSAPKSDMTMVATPPARPLVKSRTVIPSKTCAMPSPSGLAHFCPIPRPDRRREYYSFRTRRPRISWGRKIKHSLAHGPLAAAGFRQKGFINADHCFCIPFAIGQ